MNSPLTLHCGQLRCDIRPDLGGCVAGLWLGAVPVLQSTAAAKLLSVRGAGSYPLVPYSNRVGYGRLHWQGRQMGLPLNFAPEPHAIHGVGWERAWALHEHSDCHAVLHYHHAADATATADTADTTTDKAATTTDSAAWPFAFDSSQRFTLSEQALEMQISITNCSPLPAPAGLGWHPYFAKNANSRVAFAAHGRWEMGPDKLPTGRLAHAGLHTDCRSLAVDHCFDGWDGLVQLQTEALAIRVTSDLRYLVVYTTPERDSIAIEPVSHVNNALALAAETGQQPEALGVRVLQSGQTFSAQMRIELEQKK